MCFRREFERAIAACEHACTLAPNNADVHAYFAEVLNYTDEPERSLEFSKKAMRLDPLGPPNWEFHIGHSYYKLKRLDEAVATIRHSVERSIGFPVPYLFLAVLYHETGRAAEASQMIEEALSLAPNYTLNRVERVIPHRSASEQERFLEGLRKAGLPE